MKKNTFKPILSFKVGEGKKDIVEFGLNTKLKFYEVRFNGEIRLINPIAFHKSIDLGKDLVTEEQRTDFLKSTIVDYINSEDIIEVN